MSIKQRVVFPWRASSTVERAFFFVPESGADVILRAVAQGGQGGTRVNATFGGGGGGAGACMEQVLTLKGNSVIWIENAGNVNLVLKFFPEAGAQFSAVVLGAGVDGGAATAGAQGVGGASGNGSPGGVLTSSETKVPFGLVDAQSTIHSTGGFAGLSGTLYPIGPTIDYAYSAGPSNQIQRYKMRHCNTQINQAGFPGAGGCSYFGATIHPLLATAFSPGFGAGGYGELIAGLGANPGGPAMVEVEWL